MAGGWRVIGDISSGEALAGNAIAYSPGTNFYKPNTIYVQSGITADNGVIKAAVRWSQDVWGPEDYQTQLGWTYHHIYQASLSYIFLRDAEFGVRYTGTRMTNDFIGSDTGAFNEYNVYLTYHFTAEASLRQEIPKRRASPCRRRCRKSRSPSMSPASRPTAARRCAR